MLVQRIRRSVCVLSIVASLLAAPSATFGALPDGEVNNAGDSDSVTDVFVSGGRATVDTEYIRDCPGGLSNCWIEVRFASRCPEVWCGWTYQNWRALNSSGTAQADCLGAGNEDNEWLVQYRIGYTATSVKTVEFWGENELVWTIGGSFVYRLLGEVLFNVTNNTGTRYGTKIKTTTASSAYLDPVEAATSGGRDLITC